MFAELISLCFNALSSPFRISHFFWGVFRSENLRVFINLNKMRILINQRSIIEYCAKNLYSGNNVALERGRRVMKRFFAGACVIRRRLNLKGKIPPCGKMYQGWIKGARERTMIVTRAIYVSI